MGQPGGLNGGGLTAEANTFSIKLAEAHIQDSKAEEKGERDRELEKREHAAQK